MARTIVNELSSLYLTFDFTDENSASFTPTSVDWRVDNIDDPHTPVQILDWQSATPLASVNVQIPGANNAITNQDNNSEKRVVTVRMDSALSTQAYQDKVYLITNKVAAS